MVLPIVVPRSMQDDRAGRARAAVLNQPSCRQFFKHSDPLNTLRGSPLSLYPTHNLLLATNSTARPAGTHLRTVTWEDHVFSHTPRPRMAASQVWPSSKPTIPDFYIMPLAVGSQRRPVKIMMRLGFGDTMSFVCIPIFKSASTTLTWLLGAGHAVGPHACPHTHANDCGLYLKRTCALSSLELWATSWGAPSPMTPAHSVFCSVAHPTKLSCPSEHVAASSRACLLHGSFVLPTRPVAAGREHPFVFAFVRDPLDRFLSTMRPAIDTNRTRTQKKPYRGYDPHGLWRLCNGERMCPDLLEDLKVLSPLLERKLTLWASGVTSAAPADFTGLLTHTLTQMYFLSATNAAGMPLRLDFVGKLENFATDWAGTPCGHPPTHAQLHSAHRPTHPYTTLT